LKLSIVIPVYNEKKYICEVIDRVIKADIGHLAKEIIVVDDYSTDGTRDILKKKIEPLVDRVIYKARNQGKSSALRVGFSHVTGDFVVVQDADLEYDPAEYIKLLRPILEDKADVVFGSRFAESGPRRGMFFWRYVGNRFLTLLSNMFSNLNLTDMETCYKMFRKDVIDSINIEQNGFGFEPEFTAKVARGNWRIHEVGISYSGRTYSEGKKINWKDAFHALYCILKYNLFTR
jgi:glycosyltransferase involved in cell wall biosynthesis